MSDQGDSSEKDTPLRTPQLREPLTPIERRVLGVLIEKQKTSKSPDAYPMTLNALTTGCNQKSNRDPVVELSDDDVEETLVDLQKKGLTLKIVGGRADRYRHQLYDVWRLSKLEMALLAELLLRGPQTEGDLRSRAARMEDMPELDEFRGILKSLVDRNFIVYLTPADRRGAIITHGFHTSEELQHYRGPQATMPPAPVARPAPAAHVVNETALLELAARLDVALHEIAMLKEAVARLQERLE